MTRYFYSDISGFSHIQSSLPSWGHPHTTVQSRLAFKHQLPPAIIVFQHDFDDVTLDDVMLDAIAFLSEPYLLLLIERNIYIYIYGIGAGGQASRQADGRAGGRAGGQTVQYRGEDDLTKISGLK